MCYSYSMGKVTYLSLFSILSLSYSPGLEGANNRVARTLAAHPENNVLAYYIETESLYSATELRKIQKILHKILWDNGDQALSNILLEESTNPYQRQLFIYAINLRKPYYVHAISAIHSQFFFTIDFARKRETHIYNTISNLNTGRYKALLTLSQLSITEEPNLHNLFEQVSSNKQKTALKKLQTIEMNADARSRLYDPNLLGIPAVLKHKVYAQLKQSIDENNGTAFHAIISDQLALYTHSPAQLHRRAQVEANQRYQAMLDYLSSRS